MEDHMPSDEQSGEGGGFPCHLIENSHCSY